MATSGACAECGAERTAVGATIVDRSGGAFIRLCADCQALLTARCGRCGDPKAAEAKADRVIIHGGSSVPICDECRRSLMHSEPAGGVPGWGELLADGGLKEVGHDV